LKIPTHNHNHTHTLTLTLKAGDIHDNSMVQWCIKEKKINEQQQYKIALIRYKSVILMILLVHQLSPQVYL
jgi:hypothetical protein